MTATDTPTIPAPTRQRAVRPPATTVKARPLLAAAGNAATISGATLVNFTGPAGLAVLAAGAATAAGVGAATRMRSNRRSTGSMWRSASPRTPGSRSLSLPKLGGGSLGGSSSRRAASGRSGSPTGRSAAGRSIGGRLGSLLGGPASRTGASTSGAGHRRSGSTPGGTSRRSPLTAAKVAAARRKLADRSQAGPRLSDAIRSATTPGTGGKRPTARQAWSAARRAVTGDNPKRRGTVRRAAAGLAAAGLAAGKTAWDANQRRKKAAAARQAKNDRAQAQRKQTKPAVGTTVRRPAGQQKASQSANSTSSPVAKPAPITHTPGRWPAPAGGTTMSVRQLRALAEDFLAAAMRDQPEGMLQVVAEAHQMPEVLELLAKAMNIRYQKAQQHPIHPAIKDMYGAVHKTSMAVVKSSLEIGPALERIHKDELERLRNPRLRGDEKMWDVRANRDAA